jgi:hypothetical protein
MKSDVKEVPGFPGYFVDKQGTVYSTKWRGSGELTPRKPSLTSAGYHKLGLTDPDGNVKTMKVHRIIAMTYLPNPKKLEIVNHKNGKKTDNRLANLEWTDAKGNAKHYQEYIRPKTIALKTSKTKKQSQDTMSLLEQVSETALANSDPQLFHSFYRLLTCAKGKTVTVSR